MSWRTAAAFAELPAAFALGALAARASLASAPARIAIDRAQPFVIVTAWGRFGSLAFALLAATLALATVATIALVRARDEPQARELPIVLTVAAASLLAIGAWPYAFSSDVYAYAAYGAMTRAGLDPYALVPPGAHGAFFDAARWQWSGPYPVCVYGPAYVLLATLLVALFGGNGVGATLLAFRIAGALAFLGSVALAHVALGARPAAERRMAVRAYALNPVVLWAVGEGHNDAWFVLAIAGAAALGRSRAGLAAALTGLSLLLKAPGAGYGAALALDGRLRPRARALAIAGVAVAAAVSVPIMAPALAALGAHGRYAPTLSLQGLVGVWPAVVAAALAGALGARRVAGGERSGYAWLGIAVTLALPNAYPWYALWLVPFAIAAGPGRASSALWAATILAALRYLPDAAGSLDPRLAVLAALLTLVPLAYALTDLRGIRRPQKVSPAP